MVQQLFEFVINHWILSTIWVALLAALLVTESSKGGKGVTPQQATTLINTKDAKVVDLRTKDEFRKGHLPGAINIPSRDFANRMSELSAYKETPIILVCKTGTSAGASGALLNKAGFKQLHKLRGGVLEWQNSSLPLVKS
ncbi:rhodanese-like domain-containing protein [Saccharospirillum mangrovi]|uniref:rhodanese-like domain-containing protein n=1 Tax=Saccharospirillum mangrovi TaxID=2161747 RepID=UPI000D33AFF6|nr:rhodanese-like domain-containing protein [Saccharospirillum mangrovi]